MRRAYLYAGDLFKPPDLTWGELVELAEKPEAVLERFGREVEELAARAYFMKLVSTLTFGTKAITA